MKFKGMIGSMFSGSAGGVTASHNRGGYYLRQRVVPTDPASEPQLVARDAMSVLAAAWRDELTDEQRAGWNLYAEGTPLTNPLGDPVNVSGKGMYVRGNLPRLVSKAATGIELVRQDDPPETLGLPTATAGIDELDASDDTLEVTFDNTQDWASNANSALLLFTSRPLSAGVTFFTGPYRLSGTQTGGVIPPTSPVELPIAFPVVTGGKIGVRIALSTEDGRLSADLFRGFAVATA